MTATHEPGAGTSISPAELQEIVRVFADSDLRELRLAVGEVELLVSRNDHVDLAPTQPAGRPAAVTAPATPAAAAPAVAPAPAAAAAPAAAPAAPAAAAPGSPREGLHALTSPAVGTFYRRPAPDQPPFVEAGTKVAVGDPVGTIEVMKMFTTVTADVAGTVVEIQAEEATLVEHGQVLLYVDPADA